jgi:hypothetical protein
MASPDFVPRQVDLSDVPAETAELKPMRQNISSVPAQVLPINEAVICCVQQVASGVESQ